MPALGTVRINNLTKRFGNTFAIKALDLKVEDKSFVVLLGPSGCGKTTTLRCIAGLETPDEGEIYIGDRCVTDLPPKARDTAMVFQNYALYPHMTVYNNMAFPLKMRGIPKDQIEKNVNKTAELLKIKHLLDRMPKQLSGGEAQRAALGRAMVREPEAFLMDEPLSNLDARLRVHMRAELKRLQKELGFTVIYVTHDQVEAMTMADKIAVINQGTLQQFASAEEVFNHPANLFVGGFIGSPPMNLINCTLIEKDDSVFLDAGAFTVNISDDIRDLIKEKTAEVELILGIRPNDISLAKKWTSEANLQAEVYIIEPLGSETMVDIKVGDEIIKARVPCDFVVGLSDTVWMSINTEKMHIFDKKTEKAIL